MHLRIYYNNDTNTDDLSAGGAKTVTTVSLSTMTRFQGHGYRYVGLARMAQPRQQQGGEEDAGDSTADTSMMPAGKEERWVQRLLDSDSEQPEHWLIGLRRTYVHWPLLTHHCR